MSKMSVKNNCTKGAKQAVELQLMAGDRKWTRSIQPSSNSLSPFMYIYVRDRQTKMYVTVRKEYRWCALVIQDRVGKAQMISDLHRKESIRLSLLTSMKK